MRRTTITTTALGLALAIGCYREEPPAAAPQQGYGAPPPRYYPQQPPPGYPQQQGYPPQQQPGYPPQPQPPQPAPTQPQPQPPTAPTSPYNPWLTMLGNLLNGGAPPAPSPGPQPTPTAPSPAPPPPTIDARGLELAAAINIYRVQNGLPPIAISKSLSHVAATHVHDLQSAPKPASTCNGHSWSANGPWTPCCYTADHAQAKCMWQKPAELTAFTGTGFEITLGQPGERNATLALDPLKAITAWQGSPLHNDVMLNRGTWQSMTWRAMGAGIIDSHACAWFSDQADTTP